jgi:hypothetical protein
MPTNMAASVPRVVRPVRTLLARSADLVLSSSDLVMSALVWSRTADDLVSHEAGSF